MSQDKIITELSKSTGNNENYREITKKPRGFDQLLYSQVAIGSKSSWLAKMRNVNESPTRKIHPYEYHFFSLNTYETMKVKNCLS